MGILNIFGKSKKKKSFHLINLINVANRDGILDKNEIEYITHIGHKLGFSKMEIFNHFENPSSYKLETPISPKEVIEQLFDMVAVMLIDNDINKKEIEYITAYGVAMGIEENYLHDTILEFVTGIKENIDKENIRDSIKKLVYR